MSLQNKIKIKKQEQQNLKKLKIELKRNLKTTKEEYKKEKSYNYNSENLETLDNLKKEIKKKRQENKKLIKEQKMKILELEPIRLTYLIKKHKCITFMFSCLLLISMIIGIIFFQESKHNFENEYFSFKYNKEEIFINDYTSIADMWIVSTGGGVYEPTLIMIGYTEYGNNISVEKPLKNLQDKFGGEKTEEKTKITENFASDDYLLYLDKLQYKVLSKSYKKDNKILTIMYINAGNLTEEQQADLYQVYDSIKLKN